LASNMFFRFFRFKIIKMQMLNYSKRLSMRREIQNPLMFETDPESFSPAKHFSARFSMLFIKIFDFFSNNFCFPKSLAHNGAARLYNKF
jgi:hypothetical protein